jgi:hypothetical protein
MAKEYFRPLHERLASTVRKAIDAGEFREMDADQTAMIALGVTTSYFAAASIMSDVVQRDLLAPEAVETRKRAVLDFLRHAVANEGAQTR